MAAANVFISYAHEDTGLKELLLQHLAGLVHDGLIRVWHDRDIKAGDYWVTGIDNAIELSSLILLLVSPAFLSSSYCYGPELRRALRKAAAGEARVIPIILRPSDWRTGALQELQALPRDGRAVTSHANPDEAFLQVAEELRALISSLPPPAIEIPAAGPSRVVRYYLYISDAKVDMLLPQIAPELEQDPESSTHSRRLSTRIRRLETVLRHIERHDRVGSIDEPGDYVAATQELYLGIPARWNREACESTSGRRLCGPYNLTQMLLCGATRHLVGSAAPEDPGFSSSHVPSILSMLMTSVELDGLPADAITRAPGSTSEEERLPRRGRELALWLIANADITCQAPAKDSNSSPNRCSPGRVRGQASNACWRARFTSPSPSESDRQLP